jgi:hypothetical protein
MFRRNAELVGLEVRFNTSRPKEKGRRGSDSPQERIVLE